MIADAGRWLKIFFIVYLITLQHDRLAAGLEKTACPERKETVWHVGVVIDIVDDLPLAQPAITGQRHAARADTSERQCDRPQRLAAIGKLVSYDRRRCGVGNRCRSSACHIEMLLKYARHSLWPKWKHLLR
jgi:hypothetical protein